MKVDWIRIHYDWTYIFLNRFINQIPCWTIRRYFYKKYKMKLKPDSRIGIGTIVLNPKKISLGTRSVVNENCFLDGRGGLQIGRDTSISAYTRIISASHKMNSGNFQYFERKTVIGNHVWIGTGATILDGAQIKDYSVIGAGAVLKGIVGRQEVFAGNPAKRIKKRKNMEDYHLKYKAYFR